MNYFSGKDISLVDMKNILEGLKSYRDLKMKLGKRGIKVFENLQKNQNSFVVEYFSSFSFDEVEKLSLEVYKKAFGIDVNSKEIEWKENDNVKGGIKVYKNDFVVDISFSKIEKQFSL